MSGSVEAVPPAADCNRSVGTRRVARSLKDGREEPIVVLFSRGVLAAGVAALEGLIAKGARRETVPQRLENVQFAPGNGMGPAAQYLVERRAATVLRHREERSDVTIQSRAAALRPLDRFARDDDFQAARVKLHNLAPNTLKSLARLSTLRATIQAPRHPGSSPQQGQILRASL